MIGLSERGKVGTVKNPLQRTVTKETAPIEQSKPGELSLIRLKVVEQPQASITNMRIYTLIHKVE